MDILFIDNFDSFAFNLVDEFKKREVEVDVWRNDVAVEQVLRRVNTGETAVVISPGPGTPAQAGCCLELIRHLPKTVPLFGVCLGHQALVEGLGGVVGYAGETVHGKTSAITHDDHGLFEGLPNPLKVARYHSLAALTVPPTLRVIASLGSIPMAVEHVERPMFGVQFHPESILTESGGKLIENVVKWFRHHISESTATATSAGRT